VACQCRATSSSRICASPEDKSFLPVPAASKLQNKITRDLKNGVMDAAILHGSDGHGEGAPTRSNRQGESTDRISLDRLPGAIAGENIAIEYRTASWNGCSRLLRFWSGSAGHCRHRVQSGHGCGHEGDHDHPDRHDQQCRSSWARFVASLARPGANVTGCGRRDFGQAV
jgi:hypothetical protein